MVIIGATAEGLGGFIASPTGPMHNYMPSAVSLQTMMDGETILRPWWSRLAELAATGLLGLFIIVGARFFSYKWAAATIVWSAMALVGSSWWLWSSSLMLLDVTMPIISVILVGFHAIFLRFILEFRQKQQIKKQFGTYLSPDLVAKLQKNPELLQLGGESKELSIMFTDVRGFTSISEHYGEDVQGLTQIMNRYMTAMTAKILENNGTIDKYIGDAQMAFWNAPVDNENHIEDSVKTALQMMTSLEEFNNEIDLEGIPPFRMGLGINTDTVVVGNMGSDQRFDYTCIGDGVNTGARLEGQTKNYCVDILLGPKTAEAIMDDYIILEMDNIAVKGKTEGVQIYTIIEEKTIETINASGHHAVMFAKYRDQDFEAAITICNSLKVEFGGKLKGFYEMWIERCEGLMQQDLPSDWDGIFRATSK
jgi:adenylate cyclase